MTAILFYLREAKRKTELDSPPECILLTRRQQSKAETGRFQSKCEPKILHERSMRLLENITLESCENSIAAGSQYSPGQHPEQ